MSRGFFAAAICCVAEMTSSRSCAIVVTGDSSSSKMPAGSIDPNPLKLISDCVSSGFLGWELELPEAGGRLP